MPLGAFSGGALGWRSRAALKATSRQVSGLGSPQKPGGGQLRVGDRFLNGLFSSAPVVGEPVIAGLKRCRVVKEVLRLKRVGSWDRVMEVACGLHNQRVSCRHRLPIFDLFSLVRSG